MQPNGREKIQFPNTLSTYWSHNRKQPEWSRGSFKTLNWLGPGYLTDLLLRYQPSLPLPPSLFLPPEPLVCPCWAIRGLTTCVQLDWLRRLNLTWELFTNNCQNDTIWTSSVSSLRSSSDLSRVKRSQHHITYYFFIGFISRFLACSMSERQDRDPINKQISELVIWHHKAH